MAYFQLGMESVLKGNCIQLSLPLGYTERTMSPLFASILVLIAGVVILRMQPRRFYFIRHGETILNEQHIRQGEDGALSENGKSQAE